MRRLSAHSLFALAVFVLGGLVAPALHRVEHAEEQVRERASHVAAGHHHHTAGDAHGTEVVAPCPEPVAVDLQCVLCHGVSVYLPSAPAASLAPAGLARLSAAPHARIGAAPPGLLSIRGPPEPVA